MINNLKILNENPHLLEFIKKCKTEVEFTNAGKTN